MQAFPNRKPWMVQAVAVPFRPSTVKKGDGSFIRMRLARKKKGAM
jgi:hypothetical protein